MWRNRKLVKIINVEEKRNTDDFIAREQGKRC
jgi:hypothetical protein